MKKLLVGVVVCSMASLAAGAGFQLGDGSAVVIDPGGQIIVPLNIIGGQTGIAGAALYLEVSAPFQILDLNLDGTAVGQTKLGTIFDLNTTGASIYTNARQPDVVAVPQLAVGYVTTASGTVTAAAPSAVVAFVTLGVPADAMAGTEGTFDTNGPSLGVPSDLQNASGDNIGVAPTLGQLIVTPEPVTALLLLAGVPFLRRRRA